MKNKDRGKSKKIYLLLDIAGWMLLILAYIFCQIRLLHPIFIELLAITGLLLSMPDNINFIKKQINKDEKISIFWIGKSFAVFISLIGLIIAFIIELHKLF